jgi:CheY-like chemotaxis protein
MSLAALLVGADENADRILSSLLEELNISVHSSKDFAEAWNCTQQTQFDALIVDCQRDGEAQRLIRQVRDSASNKAALIAAVVDHHNQVKDILSSGANFVLYKPISRERTANSMRAARDLIRRERRVSPRIPVQSSAMIDYPGNEGVSADLLNLSQEGIAFHAPRELPPCCKVYFQFSLPTEPAVVRLSGEVMWQDAHGRVGLRFAHVPQSSRRVLQQWIDHSMHSPVSGHASPAISVEDSNANRLTASLGLLSQSAPDRRDPTRKPCTLSAEVHAIGNDVPNRCTITDVSYGGCYVETTNPFAVGAALEIVVRTSDTKFSLPGMVQKTDPGFGMGVKFLSQTERQKTQIAQLVEHVTCQPKFTR